MRLSRGLTKRGRIGWACAVATGALVVSPLDASARHEQGGLRATTAAAGGTVYGGVTAQDFPVVIETNKSGRKIVKATIAIRLTCTSGGTVTLSDGYRATVSKKRKFSVSFGPVTQRNDDGTTTDLEGSLSGSFNKARTTVSGKWSYKGTEHAASGAVTDTCDSGSVSWKAKQ